MKLDVGIRCSTAFTAFLNENLTQTENRKLACGIGPHLLCAPTVMGRNEKQPRPPA
jgi:hypothetical protein